MRKHFLLLMLMTLLPLAGWAQTTDISSDPKVSMSTGTTVFGGSTAPAIQVLYDGYKLTVDDGVGDPEDYKWDGKYYTTSACTVDAGAINKLEVGTYWIQVEGVGVYTGKRVASFEVTKKPLTVTLKATLTKVYGAPDPALTDDNIDWSGAAFEGTDDKSVFTGTLAYTYDNGNLGSHDINVSGYTAKNYTLSVTAAINITAKPIAAGMITPVTLSENYKGAAFDAFAVNIKDGSTPLVAGTDFVLGVYSDEAMTVTATPINVGKYYLGITAKAGANYSVTGTVAVGTFVINKAGLTVRALNQTMVYNASQVLPDATTVDVAYQLIGVQGKDVFTAPTLTVGNGSVGANNAGAHPITPSYASENSNYDYNYVEGTLTITKRELTITANDAKKVYKKAESTVTKMDGTSKDGVFGYAGVTITPTPAFVGDTWDVPVVERNYMGNSYSAKAPWNGTLRVNRTDAGTVENKGDYEDALTLTWDARGTVWNNYDIVDVAGDFHITGGKLYITALKQSKNYGQDDPAWAAVEEKAGNENPNYRVDGISAPDVVTGVTLTRVDGETVGDYAINITASGVPTGYEEIVFVPGTFTIKQRPLAVTAKVQTLEIGDGVADLDQNAYVITSTNANEGLVEGDNASDVFSLSIDDAITGSLPLTAENVYKNAIIKVNGTKAANYNITFNKGNLIVIDPASTIVLNRPAKAAYTADPTLDDAAAVITTAAAAKYTQAQADAYNATLPGAVMPGEETGKNYTAATAEEYNAKLEGAVEAGEDTGDDYDATSAAEYNAKLDGAVKAGDDTGKTYDATSAEEYNATLPGAVEAGDETGKVYDATTAAEYNATLPGAVEAGDDTGKTYDATSAAEYNATLPGAVEAGDDTGKTYDATSAAEYNAELDGAVKEGDTAPGDYNDRVGYDPVDASSLTADEAAAYNATLTGAVSDGDAILYTAETAAEKNAELEGAVSDGDPILYTAETAAEKNAELEGAVSDGDDILYTAETAAEKNAELEGAVSDGDPILYTAETATEKNATLDGAVKDGDDILYTEETAAAENAKLTGAVKDGDPILYTAETAAAYNAKLDGHKTTADQRPFAVTFGDFSMVAEKWYPIVLPFATSVKEISNAFGYAIVNILKKDNTDNTKIAFKLHMGEIPANEPFVVKVYEDLNMNETFFGDPADVTNRKLIASTDAPQVADASGVKFIGSYSAKTDGFRANEAFFSVSTEKNDYYWGSDTNTTYMAPLAAYFQLPAGSSARSLVFEEPDGTYTAIEAVKTVNEVKNNEGWYTVGGVKLQNAPVEKGIYINNGKKVVIK